MSKFLTTNDTTSMGGVSELQAGSTESEEESLQHFFNNQIFVTRTGDSVLGLDALGSISILGLYFSASWCPPCRQFTPLLAQVHQELTKRKAPFQVIYVPFDKTESDMWSYTEEQHGDWLCIPLKDSGIEHLTEKFNISYVPKLIIVTMNGDVISTKGRKEVQDRGVIAFRSWMSASGVSQQNRNAATLNDLPSKPKARSSSPPERSRSAASTMAMTLTSKGDLSEYNQSDFTRQSDTESKVS